MSKTRIYKENKCFEKIQKIILNNFKYEIDKFSKVVEPEIYNFLYFKQFSEREIREYLKNADDSHLEKILNFKVNIIDAFVVEIQLLKNRIVELEQNTVEN
jgi:hypothetical protein